MLNILRSIAGITKASLVHMRREVFISKHYAGMSKRPLSASDAQVSDLLIFPLFLITASHAAFIFLCCVYGSHSFPYFSQSGQLIFLYAVLSGLRSFPYFCLS